MPQAALIILLGLVIGSFLSAFTYRFPKKISVIFGRSFCPECKHPIAAFNNIPLLSFLLLRGKCRSCNEKISYRYPFIEATTAITFLALFKYSDLTTFVYLAPLAAILISIFVIDLEHKIIPDELVFLGILWVLGFYLFLSPALIFKNFLVGLGASLFFLLIHLITRGRGMGLGDVKFAILGGGILGWPLAVVWLFLAFAGGALIGVLLILLKKAKFGREIPFGPYLAGSLIVTIIWGQQILAWYFLHL